VNAQGEISMFASYLSSAAAVFKHYSKQLSKFGILSFLLMASFWSTQAMAMFSCSLSANAPTSVTVAPNGSASFTVSFNDFLSGCGTNVPLTFTVSGDTTGGVTPLGPVNAPYSATAPSYTFNVTAGALGGGTATITVTCTSTLCNGSTAIFTINTTNTYAFTAVSPATVTTNQLIPVTLSTNLLVNGAGSGNTYSTSFVGGGFGTAVNNAAGNASSSSSLFFVNPGVNVTASVLCPTPTPAGCPPAPLDFTIVVEAVTMTNVSPSAVALNAGASTTMTARYGSASLAAPTGQTIFWSIDSGPAGGDGNLTGTTPTNAAGNTQANFTATVPGTYVVRASSNSTFIADNSESFTITVSAITRTLAVSSGNNQSATVGTALPLPLVALAQDNAVNAAGITINWTTTGGTLSAATSVTNAAGLANINLTLPATAGAVTITGTRADDGTAVATFTATATAIIRTLAVSSGNNQSAPTGTALPLPLVVLAQNNGVNTAGVPVSWTSTGGTLSAAASTTNAAGLANVNLTLPATAGVVTVTATRTDDPTLIIATFTATATLTRTLAIVSGNGQNGTPGSPLAAPLVVSALNNGVATAGIPINWTISPGATLGAAVNATNAAGQATNTATLGATPGAVTITATRQDDATATVSFTVNAVRLASIPNLTPQQRSLATALDTICTRLNTLATPNAGQVDLIARCNELGNNVTTNPAAVVGALQALLPDAQAAQNRASLLSASRQFEIINARIAALRSGTQGTSFEGLALNGPKGGSISLGSLMNSLMENNSAANANTEVGTDFQRWGFFASGSIGSGDADAAGITPEYDFDIRALTLGVDYRYSDKFIFGAALGYSKQDTELAPGQGGVDARGYTLSAYSTYFKNDSWYTDAALTFGNNNYDLVRNINYTIPNGSGGFTNVNQTARADSGGDLLSFGVTFGRDFQKGGWSIGPYGRILYTRLNFDRIQETLVASGPGAGLALIVEERSLDSLASVLGAKFTKPISMNWGVLTPHFQVEWEHEFKSDPGAINARFVNDPSGTTIVLADGEYDDSYFRVGVGLSAIMAKGRSAFMYYDTAIARDGISQYNLAIGLRFEF
jgi:uncharacterized protein YhjY with autotransporter beta-barrel domain